MKIEKGEKQIKVWGGEFGKQYTKRNNFSFKELNNMYLKNYGISRTELNNTFVGRLNREIRILEVGSNMGNQLLCLQEMGFKNLYGIDINKYAIGFSKKKTKNVNIIEGSILDIPYKDRYFDLVFTSGVLIHIAPSNIKKALKEIYRCSNRYIWGFEYYSKKYESIQYRGRKDLLWKTNFSRLYLDQFNNLKLVKEKILKYVEDDNLDAMFLLKKINE